MKNVGKCVNVSGDVSARSKSLGDGLLVRGAYVQVKDQIQTADASFVYIEFLDGSRFALSENSQMSVDAFGYRHEPYEDFACFTVTYGKFVCISGAPASSIGDFSIQLNNTTISMKSARLAGRIENADSDFVTLLPQRTGPAGKVLAHTKAAVASIDRAYQTLRISGVGHDLPTPLTLPSQVVIETYMGPGLEKAFLETVINGADIIDNFQPFDILNDQFLERQFISKHVYPSDVIREEPSHNELLEDAFIGERFQLRDGER